VVVVVVDGGACVVVLVGAAVVVVLMAVLTADVVDITESVEDPFSWRLANDSNALAREESLEWTASTADSSDA
jgi:hypothetical protein